MAKVGKIAKGVAIGLVVAIILNIALMAVIWFAGLRKYYKPPKELAAVRDYSVSENLVPQKVIDRFNASEKYSENYALGVNADGNVVFLKPKKAWKAAKKENKYGIKKMDKTFKLKHRSKTAYLDFIEAEDKIDGTDWLAEEKAQAHQWVAFLRIYENSFPENARR